MISTSTYISSYIPIFQNCLILGTWYDIHIYFNHVRQTQSFNSKYLDNNFLIVCN